MSSFRFLLINHRERKIVIVESLLCPTEFREVLAKVLYIHFEVIILKYQAAIKNSKTTSMLSSGSFYFICPFTSGHSLHFGYCYCSSD